MIHLALSIAAFLFLAWFALFLIGLIIAAIEEGFLSFFLFFGFLGYLVFCIIKGVIS